ncbi:MAG: hypothetical protein WCA35_21125 [Kovacikia sp.]
MLTVEPETSLVESEQAVAQSTPQITEDTVEDLAILKDAIAAFLQLHEQGGEAAVHSFEKVGKLIKYSAVDFGITGEILKANDRLIASTR